MSPKLEKEKPPLNVLVRFVRDGEKVAWEDPDQFTHTQIAEEHQLGQPTKPGSLAKRVAGDAGLLANMGKEYLITGDSGAVVPRGNAQQAREETAKVVAKATGKPVKVVK
jgi:hypothetical protein